VFDEGRCLKDEKHSIDAFTIPRAPDASLGRPYINSAED
jgi:hypothetical protein